MYISRMWSFDILPITQFDLCSIARPCVQVNYATIFLNRLTFRFHFAAKAGSILLMQIATI